MTHAPNIRSELDRVAALIAVSGNTQPMQVATQGGRLEAEITQVDQLACALQRLGYRTDKLSQASVEEMKTIAEALSKRLSYLLESISPVEIDNDACVVQMRSSPPEKDDQGARYYELVVNRTGLSLWRYQKTKSEPRQIISAHVTREVFERLANDFMQACT